MKLLIKTEDDCETICQLIYFNKTIDAFCPECLSNSTFKGNNEYPSYGTLVKAYNLNKYIDYTGFGTIQDFLHLNLQIELTCSRDSFHIM